MVRVAPGVYIETIAILKFAEAAIAQLGERQTEDLKVPASIPGLGMAYAVWIGCMEAVEMRFLHPNSLGLGNAMCRRRLKAEVWGTLRATDNHGHDQSDCRCGQRHEPR